MCKRRFAYAHLTLVLAAIASAVGLRGVPVFVWIIAYLFSAFVASTVWKELETLSPVIWFLAAALGGGLTALMYLIGIRFLGSAGQPWLIFRIPGMIAPVAALTAVSGFARALYVRSCRNAAHTEH